MKKYFTNLPYLFRGTVVFFLISAIDTWFLGATGLDDMYWWSKLSLSIAVIHLLIVLINVLYGTTKK